MMRSTATRRRRYTHISSREIGANWTRVAFDRPGLIRHGVTSRCAETLAPLRCAVSPLHISLHPRFHPEKRGFCSPAYAADPPRHRREAFRRTNDSSRRTFGSALRRLDRSRRTPDRFRTYAGPVFLTPEPVRRTPHP